jgi:(1->4)-alpha-D-glucan 1-alpha-D-glucosylmutase
MVEPIVLIDADAASASVPVALPARLDGTQLRWQLTEESGALRSGQCDVMGMPRLGERQAAGETYLSRSLDLGVRLSEGYHRLQLEPDGEPGASTTLVVAPARCWMPASLEGDGRLWGFSVQLYGLRSARNWGIGDLGDLLTLVDEAGSRGAGILGLNPMHALFAHNPAHCSPYSPSSRFTLNTLYLDVEAIDDFRESDAARRLVRGDAFQSRLAALRAAALVDYVGVARAKDEALRLVYRHFREAHLEAGDARAQAFRDFQRERGRALRTVALFEALQGHLHDKDASIWGWPVWPQAYRDPEGPEVARFEGEHLQQVEYYEYLQWQTALQLERVAARCGALGMPVGLYMDLAVSVDRAGADTWAYRDCYSLGASVGAPPDDFNQKGQDWGLPPLNPESLRERGYEPFVLALRENMRHAGALRIDHVMGLMRLFWIPPGGDARSGAYVHYRLDEMLAIVALESHRNECLLIGEDLGTVADEVRDAMQQRAMLSYRLMYFERTDDGGFRPPAQYPHQALAAISTHDLPTLAGWWAGEDLHQREELHLFPTEAIRDAQRQAREADRPRLIEALEHERLLGAGIDPVAMMREPLSEDMAVAAHAYVAASRSAVMIVQIEDLLGLREQANLPGTVDEHPNWRRKLPVSVDLLSGHPGFSRITHAVTAARPGEAPVGEVDPSRPAALSRLRATYRLQLNRDFRFDDAVRIVPYLAQLGVSHVYCSPVLAARPGSGHGYDIVDHSTINPELGGAAGFDRLVAALRRHGMGLLFDMVPNHMGVLGADNERWMDVLENGPSSRFASWFDIDWNPVNADLAGKVLVPALGDHYGIVLARGDLVLRFEPQRGMFAIWYYEHRLPVDPATSAPLLARAAKALSRQAQAPLADALNELASGLSDLPARDCDTEEGAQLRERNATRLKQALADLAQAHQAVGAAIGEVVAGLNGPAERAREGLHELLERQAYRLAHWRVAADEINYRRFFDINDLAALRMENPEVFDATHALTLDLAARGLIDGVRIDHSDGLLDPAEYFDRLQRAYARRCDLTLPAPQGGRPARPLYVLVEKIAAGHERVPESWSVHGTTGYRFAAVVDGLFVDAGARARIDRIWRVFTGESGDFEEIAYQGKRMIMRSALASELTVLSTELLRIARADRRTRDYTVNALRRALEEVAACMPVYRTYIARRASAQDRRYVDWAVARATRRSRAADTTIFGFVRQTLLGRAMSGASVELAARVRRFAMRFQQFTSPVTAKGVEDTACYVFNRLVSLNDVGADPEAFGISVSAFHGASSDRALTWPDTMLAGSTHDNKRSEDVRQRINVISEAPAAWRLLLRRWRMFNRSKRRTVGGEPAPSRNDEYLLYQTLLGTFPSGPLDSDALENYRCRIDAYMLKAARESKQRTSWISHDERYEQALSEFVSALLMDTPNNAFLADLREQVSFFNWFGALNSLSCAVLRYSSPGLPDLYQGDELFDLSLVDPDNRRPVDYALRASLLAELQARVDRDGPLQVARELAQDPSDPRAKLFVIWRLLSLRSGATELLRAGDYRPLEVVGAQAQHVVAFARHAGDSLMVVIAGRLFAGLLGSVGRLPTGDVWEDTEVRLGETVGSHGELTDALTGARWRCDGAGLRLADVLQHLPGAVLVAGG